MRATIRALPLAVAFAICAGVPASAALTPSITTYPSSNPVSPSSHPYGIAAGADGALWFTDPYAHDIGRMTVDGTLTLQAPVPASTFQYAIAAGSDGAMWFVSQSPSSVSRIDEAGTILTQNLASATANPTHIVSGPDGALWFTEGVTKAIGRIPATTPLAVPDESRTTTGGPGSLASGPDGNLWFTEYSESAIGRMTPAGATTYFPLPPGIANPEGIATGPDGALWYTALNPATIVRISTDGTQKSYPLPASPFTGELTAGPDGALWFSASDQIGRITTDGTIQMFPLPAGVGLNDVAAGPDGNIWFTEENAGRIGRITTPPNATTGGVGHAGAVRAKLTGTVNGHSQPTDVAIEYGREGAATTTTPADHLSASANDQPVLIALGRLRPSTTYRYRVAATNQTGTTTGAFLSFTTSAACVVPKLIGKKLKRARKLLRRRDCRLGKVRPKGQRTGKVKKQRPKAGKVLPVRSRVNVKLG
jgi:virginiamycin B lyase